MKSTILLVEDDTHLRDALVEVLLGEGYLVDSVVLARDANKKTTDDHFDLILLDVSLPDGNGFDLCAKWREAGMRTPILFLTAKDEEYHIVRGLDAGGDDYLAKPFRLLELLSRIRALIRRNKQIVYKQDDLIIDFEKLAVVKEGKPVFLTNTEFQLLSLFVANVGKVMSRNILLQNIWDDAGMFIDDNTLSVHISRLREKIGKHYIKTIRGIGYLWEQE